jgi:hypothetical protein
MFLSELGGLIIMFLYLIACVTQLIIILYQWQGLISIFLYQKIIIKNRLILYLSVKTETADAWQMFASLFTLTNQVITDLK